MLDKCFACRFTRPAQHPLKTFKRAFEFRNSVLWLGPASAYARRGQFVTLTAAPDGASSDRCRGVGRRGSLRCGLLLGAGIWKRCQMFTANCGDVGMRNRALPSDLAITPSGPSLAAEECRDCPQLVRASPPQPVLRVRAAGEEKRVVTIAGVNLTFDVLGVGMRQPKASRR
jgi:hypothetical protein